jgi:hypothetical protein
MSHIIKAFPWQENCANIKGVRLAWMMVSGGAAILVCLLKRPPWR